MVKISDAYHHMVANHGATILILLAAFDIFIRKYNRNWHESKISCDSSQEKGAAVSCRKPFARRDSIRYDLIGFIPLNELMKQETA